MANLLTNPEDFDLAPWGKLLAGTVVSDQAIAPDDTVTADRLIDDNAGGNSSVIVQQQVSGLNVSTQHCFAVFAKADQLDWLRMVVVNFTTPADGGQYFDLGNGVAGIDRGFDDYGIEDVGSGWYRCWMTFTTDPVDTQGELRLYVAEADGDASVARDNTSSIFIWGASFNEGALPDTYVAVSGWESDANDATPFYLAVSRRKLDRPPTKRVYPKTRRGMLR